MAGNAKSRKLWASKLAGGTSGNLSDTPSFVGKTRQFRGWILGIDPSLRGSGFAVLEVTAKGEMLLHASETLKIPPKYSAIHCLGRISEAVTRLLSTFPIDHVAVEETIYVQNFRTAQILGMARGAAIAAAAMRLLPVHEYPPLRVKQAVAGFGRASKEQVSAQMKALLKMEKSLPYDESDAAAVATCHAFTWKEKA
jgi:crossover junction endodeoxyribonuclease RuvC